MRGQDARTLFDRVSRGEEGELLFDTKDPREGNRQYSRRFLPPRRLILLGGGHISEKLVPLAAMLDFSVTVADERPFHSMAAHREKSASCALRLIRNAEKVSSVCNDVVGDISGIVSGSTAAVIVTRLCASFDLDSVLMSLVISALVSGLTIGGKAIGKKIAINNSTQVVHTVSRVIYMVRRK